MAAVRPTLILALAWGLGCDNERRGGSPPVDGGVGGGGGVGGAAGGGPGDAAGAGDGAEPGDEGGGEGGGVAGGEGEGEAIPGLPAGLIPPVQAARRLTQTELDNAVNSLLGGAQGIAAALVPDSFAPYDNGYRGQQVSGAWVEGLEFAAERAAQAWADDADRRGHLLPCDDPGDQACFDEFLGALLRRAYRRPATEADVAGYRALWPVARGVVEAARLAVQAVLQDPEFLYRIEQGDGAPPPVDGVIRLTGHELATRIAFFIVGGAPDDALLDAADAGELATPQGRRAEARRLLGTAAAKTQLHRFHAMWLGYRRLPHGADLIAAFGAETAALIDRAIFEAPAAGYMELFLSDETYLSGELAAWYASGQDQPWAAGGAGWTAYGPDRLGVLSHGSVLGAFSKFVDTSPTQRGIFVRTRLMCADVPPPPGTIDTDKPPEQIEEDAPDDAAPACKLDAYRAHADNPACAGCHSAMDPIGFGLENYDLGGRRREHDDLRQECPIDGVGTLPDDLGEFSGPGELARKLADGGYLDTCAVEQLLQFAWGRPATLDERQLAAETVAGFRASGHDLRGLIEEIVAADRFAYAAAEEVR